MTRWFLIFIAAIFLGAVAQAETEAEDDRGFIQGLLEDALSGDGRTVTLKGFEGALSSNATIEEIIIADEQGAWLTLSDVSMKWKRAALLRGRINIEELSAAKIDLPRLPVAQGDSPSLEDTEVKPFELPDLPVSVDIGKVDAREVNIGAPVAGVAAQFQVDGSLSLNDGEGNADFNIKRLDEEGHFLIKGAFSNETRQLMANVELHEKQNGFLSHALNLPGKPSVDLTFKGDAPISDFTGALRLATDGRERVTGELEIQSVKSEDDSGSTRVGVNLNGDVTPLIPVEYRDFFGTQSDVVADVIKYADGRLDIKKISVDSAELKLDGTAQIRPDGLPAGFDLSGRLDAGEDQIRLPVSGQEMYLDKASISAQFDEAKDDSWTLFVVANGLKADSLRVETIRLQGGGEITTVQPHAVTADLEFALSGFDHDDPAIAQSAGRDMNGNAQLSWQQGLPVNLSNFELSGAGIETKLRGEFGILTDGLPFDGKIDLSAKDISRFAELAGQPGLAGQIDLSAEGQIGILSRSFDLKAVMDTTDLAIGQPNVDRLLNGHARINLNTLRDSSGTWVSPLKVKTPVAEAELRGNINTENGAFSLTADVLEIANIEPRLSGPAKVRMRADWNLGEDLDIHEFLITMDDSIIEGRGQIWPQDERLPVKGNIRLSTPDLNRFAELAGRPLAGKADFAVNGTGAVKTQDFDVKGSLIGSDLRVGITQADNLLRDGVWMRFSAAGNPDKMQIDYFELDAEHLDAEVVGSFDRATGGEVRLSADIPDLRNVEPRLSGPGIARISADWNAEAEELHVREFDIRLSDTTMTGEARYWPEKPNRPLEGTVSLQSPQLNRFSGLAGRSLGGRIDLDASGSVELDGNNFDIQAGLNGANLSTSIPDLDKLLRGSVQLSADMSGTPQAVSVRTFNLDTPELDITANGSIGAGQPLTLSGRLSDLGLYVSDFRGPVTVDGIVNANSTGFETVNLDLDVRGPGGVTADVSGQVRQGGQQLALSLEGQGPLGLINQYLLPQSLAGTVRFDLDVNGPPALQSVRGTLSTDGTRLALPTVALTVENIAGQVALNGAQANVDLRGGVSTGGNLTVKGPIGLEQPFNADLAINLDGIKLIDPELYETKVRGDVRLSGPLATGGRISGEIKLPKTEIRVPSTGISSLGPIPDINHINEPATVRASRKRAGLIEDKSDGGGSGGRGMALDLVIDAPNEIFVRGRGLDAELGGKLTLRGTTKDVIPSGQFELIRGRLDVLSKRLDLEEGRIFLQGDFNPYLRFVAEREIDETLIRIVIEGLVSEPEVRFESAPELPEEEVVSRLIFGRGLDNLSPFQAARLATAVASLAGGGGGVMGNLREKTGLANLDVNTNEAGETEVTAGFYISDKIYSEVAVDDEGESEVQLNLDISKSLTVKGIVQSRGNTGIGIFFEKDY